MITIDIEYFSEQDHAEAKKLRAWLREQLPVFFHEDSCNKINTTQIDIKEAHPEVYRRSGMTTFRCSICKETIEEITKEDQR